MKLTAAEILALAAAGEGKTVEFKRGVQRDGKLARTLAAFANTRGGILLVGVGDDGGILGAPHPPRTVERLREIARTRVDPPVAVEVVVVRVHEHRVVCCSVPWSPSRPHAAVDDGGEREIVVRAGSSNRAAKGAVLAGLRRPRASVRDLGELERATIAWFEDRRSLADPTATIADFVASRATGKQSAKRAFLALERAGFLVAHGVEPARRYALASAG